MNIKLEDSVHQFISSLQKPTIGKISKSIDLLEKFCNQLRMPYSKSLGRSLFELRIRGKQEIRIFYTFHQDQAVLLHGFVKKTQQTPLKELEAAYNKKKQLT